MLRIEIAPMSYNGSHSCLSFAGNGQFDICMFIDQDFNCKTEIDLVQKQTLLFFIWKFKRNSRGACNPNLQKHVLHVCGQHLFGLPLKMECTKFDHTHFDHLSSESYAKVLCCSKSILFVDAHTLNRQLLLLGISWQQTIFFSDVRFLAQWFNL